MAMKFIQMADPQFGMFASISKLTKEEAADRSREGLNLRYVEEEFDGFEPEIELFTKAIEQANHYEPDFVVMCGDMVNEADSLEQREELFRIADQLDKSIPSNTESFFIPKYEFIKPANITTAPPQPTPKRIINNIINKF